MGKLIRPNLNRRKARAVASAALSEQLCAAVKVHDDKAAAAASSSKKTTKKK